MPVTLLASPVLVMLAQGATPIPPPSASSSPAFSQWSTFCAGVEHTAAIALGDVDKDGDLDVIFGNGRHVAETDWVFSNNGHGMFYGKRPLGGEPDPTYGVALGDLDGDGSLDVVIANDLGDPSVVYRNDGKGTFSLLAALGAYPAWAAQARRALALGDLDHDGDLDVVLVGLGQDHIYINEGGGRRWAERGLGSREGGAASDARATGVALADVNGDKRLDIILPARRPGRSLVYINGGKGLFTETRPFGSEADDTTAVAVADVDADGDVDIVTGNWEQTQAVYSNDGQGHFSHHSTFGSGTERTWSVAIADMDLDGDVDVVLGNANVDYWGQDVDKDGMPDRIGFAPRNSPSRLYLNDGRGRFSPGAVFASGNDNTRPVALGDVDGDGDTDIVMGNDCQPNHVFFNSLRTSRIPGR